MSERERPVTMFTELRKRHVLQVALVYLGVGWLFIEITQFVVGNYGFSPKVLDTVFLLAVLGFPAFIVIAWYHGERGAQRVRRSEVSLLLTLGVLAGIGTYRIAVGEETLTDPTPAGDAAIGPATEGAGDARLATGDPVDLGRGSIAVLPFKNNIADDELAWMGSGLADLLTTNFAQLPQLRVVGRQKLYDLLTEEGRTESEEIPESLALTLARAAGARMMVWGTVAGTAEDLVIDAQLIELENGTVLAAERVRGSDVFEMVDSLTTRLTRELGGDRRPPPLTMSRLGTQDMEAFGAFQQGVAAERAGRFEAAGTFYEQAVEMDTTFVLPMIRLAGGDRWGPPADVAEVEAVRERIGLARATSGRRDAEYHKARALRVLERMGEGLVTHLEGMTAEDFILRLDSTLGEALSSVRVIVDSSRLRERDPPR